VKELSAAMDAWLARVGDKAVVPEKEMFLQMWPGGVQPLTARPEIIVHKKTVELNCTTKGASIGYIISDKEIKPDLNSGWKHYTKAFKVKKGQYLYVLAQRIGYKESEVVTMYF
jgi:hypothetical protein